MPHTTHDTHAHSANIHQNTNTPSDRDSFLYLPSVHRVMLACIGIGGLHQGTNEQTARGPNPVGALSPCAFAC
eukprot:2510159-Rhodomonas_salina.1